jgi:succinoglycan biosynthesis protein ExoA
MSVTKNMISIIIPTFNEAGNIEECLEAILKNSFPISNVEIIIVDGGSKDGTVNILNRYSYNGPKIHIINAPGTSVYSALNIGLQYASGDYIIRVDSRSVIPENYISKCISNLDEKNAAVAGGVQKQFGKDIYQNTIAEVLQSPFGTGNAKFRRGNFSGYVDTVYLGVFRRNTFDLVGLYDDDGIVISEDAMMNARIREKGGKIYLDNSLIVKYPAKKNIRELIRQYFIYGGAKAHTFEKYKRLTAARQYVVLLASVAAIVISILSLFRIISWMFLMIPILLYMLFTTFYSARVKLSKEHNVSFFYCLFVFPAIHFSWISGFFCRLIFGKKYADFFFKTKSKSR